MFLYVVTDLQRKLVFRQRSFMVAVYRCSLADEDVYFSNKLLQDFRHALSAKSVRAEIPGVKHAFSLRFDQEHI